MKNKSKSRTRLPRENFGIALPGDYPWKVLGYLADDLGWLLNDDDRNKLTEIIRLRDLDGLLSLSEDWGLLCTPSEGASIAERRARYQLAACLKKFRFDTERKTRVELALEKFKASEARCRAYNLEGYKALSCAEGEWMPSVFTYAMAFLQKLLGFDLPSSSVLTFGSRHGPGATLSTRCGLVSSYFKYKDWPYSCTKAAARFAREAIYNDDRWLGALEDSYRERYDIPKWRILNRQVFWDTVINEVDGNRIAFVPKSAKIERSIAIEPTLNLYLQLGVDDFIRRRLKRWGVDLDDQSKNQEMARLGSLEAVNPFVTIDLADASNSVSLKLCQLLLPSEWYDYLCALRSPKGDLSGEVISYEMISSMGNGYTFALESALFTAIIYGVTRAAGKPFNSTEVAVYGDDLIVRSDISEQVITALSNCGFRINVEKSCLSGDSRESCGCDWIQGKPVRPVFLKDVPSDVAELFNDINRLKRILSLRWGIEESKTVTMMSRWIPPQFRNLVGPYSDTEFDAHIHVSLPKGKYKNCVWTYKRLVRRPQEVRGNSFFFRKLMHSLVPYGPRPQKWDKGLAGSGSRFRVTRRNADALGITRSVVSYWRSEYADFGPGNG